MNVLLVDDHPLILTALSSVIEGMGGQVKVRGVPNADAALVPGQFVRVRVEGQPAVRIVSVVVSDKNGNGRLDRPFRGTPRRLACR